MLHRETIVSEEKDSELMDITGNSSPQAQPTGLASAELDSHGAVKVFDSLTETAPPYTVFPKTSKRIIVLLCAIAGFFSPFSAFTYFPALEYMAADLDVSLQLMNLTITVYLVIQGVIPAVLGDLADQIGRRPVYLLVLLVYVAACIGLALQKSYTALVVLRMLQSAGSSGTVALGIMVVADLAPPHSRGRYVGAMLSGPNSGPSIGPVIGGVLAQLAGWPWIFWMLTILGGICLVPFIIFFPETCRNVVGNGSYNGGALNKPLVPVLNPHETIAPPKDGQFNHRLRRVPNPFACLRVIAKRHDALLFASYSLFYLTYSCYQAALAPLVMQHYHLNVLQAGLCYLSYGIATIGSSYTVGKILDHDYQVTADELGIAINKLSGDELSRFPFERARVRSVWYFLVGGICTTIAVGWTIEKEVHLAVTIVLTFVWGVTYTGLFTTFLTLNVDLHPGETGLASVAASLTRCLAGALGVGVLQPMLDSVGAGWTFTIFGLVSATSIPMLFAMRTWGPSWRECSWASPEAVGGGNA